MAADTDTIMNARMLLDAKDYGVLSTNSIHLKGSPFGSVANYCLDREGNVLFYFSTIAQHTKNLKADNRCSLIVLESAGGNVQSEARLTISGTMSLVTDASALECYFKYFPESEQYSKFHDFSLYRLAPSAYRYIGGFGKIHWLTPEEVMENAPLTQEEERFVISHMNEQHGDSLMAYLSKYHPSIKISENKARMIGMRSRSIDLIYDGKKFTIPLSREVTDITSAREVLTEMAKSISTSHKD